MELKVIIAFFCILVALAQELLAISEDKAVQVLPKNETQMMELKLPSDKLRGEGNYFDVKITYTGPGRLFVSKPWLPWGKWVPGNKNHHDEIGSPEGKSIYNHESMRVSAAGRESSPSGTEGSFDLVLDLDGSQTRLFYVYWDACYLCTAEYKVTTLSTAKHIRSRWGDSHIESNMCVTYPGYDGSWCTVW